MCGAYGCGGGSEDDFGARYVGGPRGTDRMINLWGGSFLIDTQFFRCYYHYRLQELRIQYLFLTIVLSML